MSASPPNSEEHDDENHERPDEELNARHDAVTNPDDNVTRRQHQEDGQEYPDACATQTQFHRYHFRP